MIHGQRKNPNAANKKIYRKLKYGQTEIGRAKTQERKMVIITLLSDFGLSDGYVASMKGVILSISPQTKIIDISHSIGRHDIVTAAFTLASVVDYFPDGTIHLAVVDPEVGTDRRGIIIVSHNSYFVGPDNGVLVPAALRKGIVEVRNISNDSIVRRRVSMTFHGRDIFAPAAAYMATGIEPQEIGSRIEDYVELRIPTPIIKDGVIRGQIIHEDRFGNLITNIDREDLKKINVKNLITVELEGERMTLNLQPSYGYAEKGVLLATIGGNGLLEISVNRGDAAERTGARKGAKISISVA